MLCALLCAKGHPSCFVDARKVLVVKDERGVDSSESESKVGGQVQVQWEESSRRLKKIVGDNPGKTLVITGFICCSATNVARTLGRDGSDFSASIYGNILDASSVTIWTDVNGVLSADPRRVPDASVLPRLSYNEASELAYFGAKVSANYCILMLTGLA